MQEVPERKRLDMRVDEMTRQRLRAIAQRLELSQAAVVRTAVRELAERLGIQVGPPRPPGEPEA
jgi:hypothetical protein